MPHKKYISRHINKISGNCYKCFEGNKLNWRKNRVAGSSFWRVVRKDISKAVIVKLRPKERINQPHQQPMQELVAQEKDYGCKTERPSGLLSREPRSQGLEMGARDRQDLMRRDLQVMVKEFRFHSKFLTWHIVTRLKETFGTNPICQVEGNSFSFYPCTNFYKLT